MQKKIFKIRWGLSVKIITIVSLILIVYAIYAIVNNFSNDNFWISFIVLFIILSVCIYCLLEIPLSIRLNESEIILKKLIGQLVIRIDSISHIEPYKPDKSDIRVFGIGGVGGYIGVFMNAGIGKYRAYIGNTSQAFLIITELGKKYVLSCENRDLVISIIKLQM